MHQHQHIHSDRCSHSHSHADRHLLPVAGEHHCIPSIPSDLVTDQTNHKVKQLTYVFTLVASFSAIELAIGWYSHSTALLADAGHLFSDCLALLLALLGAWIAQRTETDGQRLETTIALFNGISLLVIAGGIGWEAIWQLQTPAGEILSLPMLAAALIGLGVNSINILLLHDHNHNDLNLKGAFLHIVADAFSSIGVLIAALAIWKMHWLWADGVISLLIAGLIAVSALPLIVRSFNQLTKSKLLANNCQEF